MKNVAIIGAGITGLSSAFYAQKNGNSVKIFEKMDRVGGVMHSVHKNGFIFETGPSTGSVSLPEVTELYEDLGIKDLLEEAPSVAGNRYILKHGKLRPLPSGLVSGLTTPLFSWKDKFGMPFEPFRKRGTDPNENLSTMVRRRLGQSILDYAIDPFVSGVYAGNPDVMIPKYALPKLYNLEQDHGSFIRGAIAKMKEPKPERNKKATKKVFSTKGGLSVLAEHLEQAIGKENFVLGKNPVVVPENGKYKILAGEDSYGPFDNVIFTAGASHVFEALPCAQEKFPGASEVLYAKVSEVAIGFKKWEGVPLNGFGALMPSKEHRNILGILYMSTLFENRAPKGGALLSVFVGGLRHPDFMDLPEDKFREMVSKDVADIMQIPHMEPDLFEVTHHAEAIPQYDLKTPVREEAYKGIEKEYPGILMGGNGIDGIGMAKRIAQGRDLANRV
ncbi:MAG: protoporphyrinogen oxidase [Fibrobacter sp.]|nr:protoporphyrinogen oxidase [Fibrobacter sp.]